MLLLFLFVLFNERRSGNMDTITMTKGMVDGIGSPKDVRYQTNLRPTIPIADLKVYGEAIRLRMDYFSECGGVGRMSFEICHDLNIVAVGNAEFALDELEGEKIVFENIKSGWDYAVLNGFITKIILLFNEFNYVEWQNEVYRLRASGKHKVNGLHTAKRKYYIEPDLEAGKALPPVPADELLAMLRTEEKHISAERKQSGSKTPKNVSAESGKDVSENTVHDIRDYVRRSKSWYVRGHYDHRGKYHKFHFAVAAIPVGENYADYRKPVEDL